MQAFSGNSVELPIALAAATTGTKEERIVNRIAVQLQKYDPVVDDFFLSKKKKKNFNG